MNDTIPTLEDISPTKGLNLDEKVAIEHFLGKSVNAAQALFSENSLYYSGDLMWMGPKAFAYYFPAFAAYLRSESAKDDSDALNALADMITFRSEHEPDVMKAMREVLTNCIDSCLSDYAKFDVDEKIYGKLRSKLAELKVKLQRDS